MTEGIESKTVKIVKRSGEKSHPFGQDPFGKDNPMKDYFRFTSDLVSLRHRHPALRGEAINGFHVHEGNRVMAYHRWLDNIGRDVVVVISLNESTYSSYELGFPVEGNWLEVFNSDVYDHWVNPNVDGNAGNITVDGAPMHSLPFSCAITIPANSVLVFALDGGD